MRALYANVHEGIAEFSMAIVKANMRNGEMNWRAVCSDIYEDVYEERMSKELFEDFIRHIENDDEIPEPFKSVIAEPDWDGGMPYISIAHYKSGAERVNVPGEPKNIFLDGDSVKCALKAKGVLYDTPLGKAVFKSLQKDLVEKREDKIRISIGFLDLEHSHGDKFTFTRKALGDKCPLCKEGVGDKIYKKGHLVHLALTRVPANPRTDMEVERSMTTKREDAESIIEDEEVIKGLDLKSQTDEALVIKAEEVVEEAKKEMPRDEEEDDDKKKMPMHDEMHKSAAENTHVSEPVNAVATQAVVAAVPAVEDSPLEKSLATLKDRVAVLKSQGLVGDEALKEIQSQFDEVGNVIKAEFTPKPSPEQVANQNLEATLRSLLSEMLPAALAQSVAPIQAELSELRASSLVSKAVPTKKEEVVPQPRSLTASLVQRAAIENVQQKVSQFDLIARQSVGLQ